MFKAPDASVHDDFLRAGGLVQTPDAERQNGLLAAFAPASERRDTPNRVTACGVSLPTCSSDAKRPAMKRLGEGFEFGQQLALLAELTRAGVRWMPPGLDLDGHVNSLFGLLPWPGGYADAIRILDTTDSKAMRVDHEGGIVWQCEGSLNDVADGLLDLPAPGTRGAPRLVIGYAPADLRRIG